MDRDIEQVADAAADGLRQQLGTALHNASYLIRGRNGIVLPQEIDALLPVAEAYAAAQVAAERERCARIVENACASRSQPEPFTCVPCRDLARTIRGAP